MVDQNQEPMNIIAKTDQATTSLLHHAPPCTTPFCCCCCSNNTFMKRRSPPSSSATATEDHRACKKLHFREQQGTIPFHNSPEEDYANMVATATHSFKGFVCDNKALILNKEEGPSNSMRLRRMKDCLREMSKCWDQVIREEEEQEEQEILHEEDDDSQGAEGDKVLSKDECGRDAEEAVRVEWADKCLSICFKCPCSKGYEILLSGNNCYYKLV